MLNNVWKRIGNEYC